MTTDKAISRLSDLKAGLNAIDKALYGEALDMAIKSLDDHRPVGHWYDKGSLSCRCSECGCKNTEEADVCPICGARMEVK